MSCFALEDLAIGGEGLCLMQGMVPIDTTGLWAAADHAYLTDAGAVGPSPGSFTRWLGRVFSVGTATVGSSPMGMLLFDGVPDAQVPEEVRTGKYSHVAAVLTLVATYDPTLYRSADVTVVYNDTGAGTALTSTLRIVHDNAGAATFLEYAKVETNPVTGAILSVVVNAGQVEVKITPLGVAGTGSYRVVLHRGDK